MGLYLPAFFFMANNTVIKMTGSMYPYSGQKSLKAAHQRRSLAGLTVEQYRITAFCDWHRFKLEVVPTPYPQEVLDVSPICAVAS